MKNVFGNHKKQENKEKEDRRIEKLYNKIETIEQQLQEILRQQQTTITTAKAQTTENTHLDRFETETIIETKKESQIETAKKQIENVTVNGTIEEETLPEEYILIKEPKNRLNAIKILEDEAVKDVHTNRKEIIKEKIEDVLRRHEMNAKELKITIVDRHKYCSKATFYRYLEQLRKEERIDSIKINGKEYLCSIPKKIRNFE